MGTLLQLTVFFVFLLYQVASTQNEIDCGDTMFTSSSGFVRLPSNPTEYSAKIDCNYTISTNNASTFSLGVLPLRLPHLLVSLADCDRDNIMIGCVSDGATELNPNTSRTYCLRSFDNIPVQSSRIVFSNCTMVKISIRSSNYNYGGDSSIPFTVSAYDADCGRTVFSSATGIINSPRFPLSYPRPLDCVYYIDVERTVTVTLESISFNLEGVWLHRWDGDYDCTHTWLTVNCLLENGSASANPNQNKKFCGDRRNPLLLKYSNCDFLTMNFVTNASVSTHGFQFRYEVISAGNATPSTPDKYHVNTSVTGRSGFIMSPHYPLSYPHNVNYTYLFHINRTNAIELQFYSFNVEGKTISYYLDTCHYDWLTIICLPQNNDYPARKYCGEKTTRLMKSYSKCDSLTLNFVSDSSITRGGFKIGYRVTSPSQQPGCGDILFSGPSGVIITSNFPDKYPYNMNCKYSIVVGRNNSVQLKLKHFELEAPRYTGYCTNDWLMVTCNETTIANPSYGKKFCGVIHWTSSLRFVDCPTLVVEFVSDSYKYGDWGSKGFVIEYTVTENANTTDDNSELDCGNTLFTESSGNVSFPITPTGYLATVNCTYTISTNRADVIWLSYTHATMWRFLQSFHCHDGESLMIGCVSKHDETELIDPSTKTPLCRLGNLRNSQQIQVVFPDCRTLKLSIRSTTYSFQETFHISFSVIGSNDICGNMSSSTPTGLISTLRLPFRYSKFVNCLYTIESGKIYSAAVSVDHIYGYTNAGKYYGDSLTITCLVNGTSVAVREVSPMTRYYPRTAGFPACQSLVLNFTSGFISEERGLTVRYRMEDYEIDCGTTLFTNTSGNISFPRNPTGYPATVNCTYTISAKDLTYIWIHDYATEWTHLLNSFQDCSTEWLMIGCESEESSELNPKTKKVYCQKDIASQFVRDNQFLFGDCRMLKLSIRSRTYDLRDPFVIGYVVVVPDEICGKTSFSDLTGTIYTPVSKFYYQKHVNCQYTIDSGQVDTFVLNIAITSLGVCENRWLTITCLVNGTVVAHPLAGRKLCTYSDNGIPGRLPACDRVMLNFTSNYVTTYSLFSVRYRIGDYELGCGASMFSKSSGVIVLPKASTDHPAAVNCTYTISTNRTRDIWLDLGEGVLKYISNALQDCSRENLTIGCLSVGATELNPNTTRVLCGSGITSFSHSESVSTYTYLSSNTKRLVFIDCPTLKVSIRSTTYDLRIGIHINFTVLGRGEICGNTSFSAQNGIISPPSLPSRYPTRINCVYAIESEHVNSVALSVDRWHIGPCYSGDWLTITCLINGTSMAHPLADKKLCGNYHTPFVARFPACRSVLLNFSSDYAFEYTGFIIRYSNGDYDPECGNTTFRDSNGVITSPEFPLSHPHSLNCLYSITRFQRNAISLSFLSFRLDGYSNSNSMNEDHCWSGSDSLTVSCLSDEAAVMNTSSMRKYCGAKTTPLTFAFPSCAVVVLHFRSRPNENARQEGFKVSYTVREADLICGSPVYGRPSGVISVPWNYADYNGALNCSYVINATKPSSISLTISSISIQGLAGGNCQRDWLLIKCIDGRLSMILNVTHISCDYYNTSTQLSFLDCAAVSIMSHRTAQTTGRQFRIDYTVTVYAENVPTTELRTTSVTEPVSITEPIGTTKNCETGCKLNPDSTKCDCLPGTSQTAVVPISQEIPITRTANCEICCTLTCDCSTTLADTSQTFAIPVKTGILVTRSAKCELGCKLSEDGTTCDCSTTHSDTSQSASVSVSMENPAMHIAECDVGCKLSADGTTCNCSTTPADDLLVNAQMSVSGERGHPIGISLTVILVVTGAICLGVFLLFRRRRAKNRSEVRIHMELEADSTEAAHRSQDQDTSL